MSCFHTYVECLNHYEIIRKYRCKECGKVFMCECEREISTIFLPHQISFGRESGTGDRIPVDGFADKICSDCRGEIEDPHPRAEIWGMKGKVERYYWREIFKTYCELLLTHYDGKFEFRDINEFDILFPEKNKIFWQKSKKIWQKIHRTRPKYTTKERTFAEFIAERPLVIRDIEAPYRQVVHKGQKIGKWINSLGNLVSVEDLVLGWYTAVR